MAKSIERVMMTSIQEAAEILGKSLKTASKYKNAEWRRDPKKQSNALIDIFIK